MVDRGDRGDSIGRSIQFRRLAYLIGKRPRLQGSVAIYGRESRQAHSDNKIRIGKANRPPIQENRQMQMEMAKPAKSQEW